MRPLREAGEYALDGDARAPGTLASMRPLREAGEYVAVEREQHRTRLASMRPLREAGEYWARPDNAVRLALLQ